MGRLDLSSDPPPRRPVPGAVPVEVDAPAGAGGTSSPVSPPQERRKFLGIKFNCCGAYAYIYVNKDGTAYEGRCPKCGKPVRLRIGPGGSDSRFFEVS